MNNSNLKNDLQKLQSEYYNNTNKNMFFKNKQKLNCATNISSFYDLNTLLTNTFIHIQNTNKIYIDYTVFKLYANPDLYNNIIAYIYQLIQNCVDMYGSYEVHVNLDGFTMSSCQRYKDVLQMYCNLCLNNSTQFNETLVKLYLYNIPNVFETISQILNPFIDSVVINKIVKYNKIETSEILQNNNNSFIEYIVKLN